MVDAKGVIRVQYTGEAPGLREEVQEKTLREDLEKTIKEGERAVQSTSRASGK
jgi:hypothetical protein